MKLRKPCQHGRYDGHHTFDDKAISDLSVQEMAVSNQRHRLGNCPGGVFLPDDALIIEKVDGKWPRWALHNLSDPPLYELSPRALNLLEAGSHLSMPTKPEYVLDALAHALSVRETE